MFTRTTRTRHRTQRAATSFYKRSLFVQTTFSLLIDLNFSRRDCYVGQTCDALVHVSHKRTEHLFG
jgi:hypothetical protein